jgi:hypothetical protein
MRRRVAVGCVYGRDRMWIEDPNLGLLLYLVTGNDITRVTLFNTLSCCASDKVILSFHVKLCGTEKPTLGQHVNLIQFLFLDTTD